MLAGRDKESRDARRLGYMHMGNDNYRADRICSKQVLQ